MTTLERFLKYVKEDTTSSPVSGLHPSTERQIPFAKMLAEELCAAGCEDAKADSLAYVTGSLPATPGYESAPHIGFIAHMDTAPDFSGTGVKPQIIENYDGGVVTLCDSGLSLDPAEFPHLKGLVGRTLVTTDGTTLLGADDKAGVAEVLSAIETIVSESLPHGKISVCFTPDEEIGEGADNFDAVAFGTEFAYTLDGSAEGEIEYENFNAYSAVFTVLGRNIHPGTAKGQMINSTLVAHEIVSMLPGCETPADTEGYEGFYHLCEVSGNVEKTTLEFIVRDHSAPMMESRLATLRHIEKIMCERYGEGRVSLRLKEQYRNMSEILEKNMHVVELAREAIRGVGLEPVTTPVRGGTDGARISYMGIPCPNLGTGGYAFHGPYEHITEEGMEKAVKIVLGIVKLAAEMKQ